MEAYVGNSVLRCKAGLFAFCCFAAFCCSVPFHPGEMDGRAAVLGIENKFERRSGDGGASPDAVCVCATLVFVSIIMMMLVVVVVVVVVVAKGRSGSGSGSDDDSSSDDDL